MPDAHKLALLLGRMLDLLRSNPKAIDDHKAALRSLIELINKRSWTVRLQGHQLVVEGQVVPPDIPFVTLLVKQMHGNDVSEYTVAHGTSALDIMHFMRALSVEPGTYVADDGVLERMKMRNVRRIAVLTERASGSHQVKDIRVTDALEAAGVIERAEQADKNALDIVTEEEGAGLSEIMERAKGRAMLPSDATRELGIEPSADIGDRLKDVTVGVSRAVQEHRLEEAIEAIVDVIRQEAEAKDESVLTRYQLALRGLLIGEILKPLTKLLLDPLYQRDVIDIMRRAGIKGTQLLLDQLVSAPTFAERRGYLEALHQTDQGVENVIGMLDHNKWYVIRNVSDLVGEMRLEEAIPALGKAMRHADSRVRRSAGVALARIGTPETVRYIRAALHESDPQMRIDVVKEVGGSGQAAFVMALVNAIDEESDDQVKAEYYRALGRIGTADAIQALAKAVRPKGGWFGGRSPAWRVGAVQGLVFAGGQSAGQLLQALTDDRDKEVQKAAREGLREISSTRLP